MLKLIFNIAFLFSFGCAAFGTGVPKTSLNHENPKVIMIQKSKIIKLASMHNNNNAVSKADFLQKANEMLEWCEWNFLNANSYLEVQYNYTDTYVCGSFAFPQSYACHLDLFIWYMGQRDLLLNNYMNCLGGCGGCS